MYNFNLLEQEEIVRIFDEIQIRQNDMQKKISVVLTTKRLLFFDFENNDPAETLRVSRGAHYIRNKEVSYIIDLDSIKSISKNDYYIVNVEDNISFEFDNKELYDLLNR